MTLTARENECFEALDLVLDRLLGVYNWRESRRKFSQKTPLHDPFEAAIQFTDLEVFTHEEIQKALDYMRYRTRTVRNTVELGAKGHTFVVFDGTHTI